MRTTKGKSLVETKRLNHALIKNLIFRNKNITRTDIAKNLSLTLPTITTTINDMLANGIVEEIPIETSLVRAGRRPSTIVFKADLAYFVGVELGPYFSSFVLLNMRGEIINHLIIKPINETYSIMLKEVHDHINILIANYSRKKILGIAIGLPGFIDCDTGIIRNNPRKDWNFKSLAKDLSDRCNIPTIIDNNVRIRAIGFEISKEQVTSKPLAYLYVSKGIACPIMVQYGIISGNNSGAGELGETILQANDKDGTFKKLDELAAERAIFENCQKCLLNGQLKNLKKIIDEKSFFTIQDIINLQEAGDTEITEIVQKSITYLGIAIANVVNLINPKFVVVDAYITSLKDNQQLLTDVAQKLFYALNEEEVSFIFHPYDKLWGAKSAALFAISTLYLDK